MADLGTTTYSSITWTAGDVITEAKLDSMVANDQAYDSHAVQGLLLNNQKAYCGKTVAGVAQNLLKMNASDKLELGYAGIAGMVVPVDTAFNINVKARAYLAGSQANLVNATPTLVNLETESYDIGSDFDTGTHLFTVPVSGWYSVSAMIHFSSVVASKEYHLLIKNAAAEVIIQKWENSPSVMVNSVLGIAVSDIVYLAAEDTLGLYAQSDAGVNTVDLYQGSRYVYMSVHLLST